MNPPDRHFRLESLADGVYAAIAEPRGFALCNAGIVDLGGTTLVFDAMLTPQAGTALGQAAARLTGRPVGLLVNSHYHGDHVRGSAAVGATQVVSTRRVRELVIERGPAHLAADLAEAPGELERLRAGGSGLRDDEKASYEGWFGGIVATPADLAFRPPELTFQGEMTVHGSRRTARILTFGGGHSPSDVLVYLPDERIAFLGDLLSIGFHPSLGDGDPKEFVRILGEVSGLRPARALPGHGPVGAAADVEAMQRYITSLTAAARGAVAEGVNAEEFAARPPPQAFEGWTFSMIYRENARFLYRRAAGSGAPAPG